MNLDDLKPAHTGEALDALHPVRAALLEWAASRIGEQNPDDFWEICGPHMKGDPGGTSWCGGFVLAGLVECVPACLSWRWQRGSGFVLARKLPVTAAPSPGDIAIWRKVPPAGEKDTWHHAFVEAFADGNVDSIDGNVLRAPKEGAARCHRSINYGPTSGYRPTFYSIEGLL